MPFYGHETRHREPKGPLVKARRVSEPRPPQRARMTNAEWRAQREAERRAGFFKRLFGRR
jgi:hypothetical protein